MLKQSLIATVIAAGTLTASVAYAEEVKEINFGIISTESSSNLKTTWQPFLDDMEEQTGIKINAFFAPDYAGIIEGMRFDKVQVAWYGNKSAMEAVDRSGGEVFAQTVDSDGNPGYWSLLVTHKDSPLESVKDVLKCDGTLNFG
ncbi:MAG: phosphate/phosphite/phosphonate ABC transporter substrate-binding protein, partial [Pseudomonadota bacterium]